MKGFGEASGSDDDLCDCGVCLEDVRTLDGELFRVNINLCKVMVRASVIYIMSIDALDQPDTCLESLEQVHHAAEK